MNMTDTASSWIACTDTIARLGMLQQRGLGECQAKMFRPQVQSTDSLGDPLRELVRKFLGENEAIKRATALATVPQTAVGLQKLISLNHLRSAVDMTGRILSHHVASSKSNDLRKLADLKDLLQIWSTRFCLLYRLAQYDLAAREMQAFDDLEFVEFYSDCYPECQGVPRESLVPFDLRLVHAQLPLHTGNTGLAISRLYYLQEIISTATTAADSATALWTSRLRRVQLCTAESLAVARHYGPAFDVYANLARSSTDEREGASLYSRMGRLALQLGDSVRAGQHFALANERNPRNETQKSVHSALMTIFSGKYSEALQHLSTAHQSDPANWVVMNSMAVCHLYCGDLTRAISVLEDLVLNRSAEAFHESVVLNLCTLYELSSAKGVAQKSAVLRLANSMCGDAFNAASLKLAVS